MDHLVDDGAGLDVAGPVHDRRDARAPLVDRALAFPIGAVVRRQALQGRGVDLAREHRVARAAVVALEEDERIVAHALLIERAHHAPDLVVHHRNLRSVGAPGRIADLLVAIEIGLRRLIGRVRGVEGEIEKERRFRIVLFDQLHGRVAEQGCRIARLLDRLAVAEPVEHAMLLVGEIVDLAEERPIMMVEAALERPVGPVRVAEVPLADEDGLVAGLFQGLRQEPLVGRKAISMRRRDRDLEAVAEPPSRPLLRKRGAAQIPLPPPRSLPRRLGDRRQRRLAFATMRRDCRRRIRPSRAAS